MSEIERLKIELEETKLAYCMARDINQFKTVFLARVAHELRSPLTRSQLALALQQRQGDHPQLQRIEMELKLLDQLLDELLKIFFI